LASGLLDSVFLSGLFLPSGFFLTGLAALGLGAGFGLAGGLIACFFNIQFFGYFS